MTDPVKGRLCLECAKMHDSDDRLGTAYLSFDDDCGMVLSCNGQPFGVKYTRDPRELLTMLRRAETCEEFEEVTE